MYTNINISWINETNTDIYVEIQDKREYDIGFNSSKLNLTWVVHSYQNDAMQINVTFDNPLEISPSIDRDLLVVYFN